MGGRSQLKVEFVIRDLLCDWKFFFPVFVTCTLVLQIFVMILAKFFQFYLNLGFIKCQLRDKFYNNSWDYYQIFYIYKMHMCNLILLLDLQTSKDGNTTTSTLSLIPKKEDSGKYLSCRAENSIIPSKVLEDGWELQIQCKYSIVMKVCKK